MTKAKQEYTVALADEAIAQEIYDSFLKEEETSPEESSEEEASHQPHRNHRLRLKTRARLQAPVRKKAK